MRETRNECDDFNAVDDSVYVFRRGSEGGVEDRAEIYAAGGGGEHRAYGGQPA